MKRRVRAFGYAFRRAAGNLRRRPVSAALAIGAVSASLLLVGLVALADTNVDAISDSWGGGVQMVVYLDDDTPGSHAQDISAVLSELPAVQSVDYVSKDRALARLRESLSVHDELSEGIDANMLPASLEVTLAPGVRDVAAAHPVVARLAATPGVEQVEFVGKWVDKLTVLASGLRGATAALFVLVCIACVFITATTMRLSLPTQPDEAQLADLLGADTGFQRAPRLIEGAVQGAAAGGIAIAGLWLLFRTAAPAIEDTLTTVLGASSVAFLPTSSSVLVVVAGAAMGLAGGWVASRRRVVA